MHEYIFIDNWQLCKRGPNAKGGYLRERERERERERQAKGSIIKEWGANVKKKRER